MAPGSAGNTSLPFVDLMELEKINKVTFRSVARPCSPGASHPDSKGRAYGGHVLAQAGWAAAQTVDKGFLLHNVTGWFILAGLVTVPFLYKVSIIRNGRSYCTRTVNVTQAEGKGMCFTCTCSFQKSEASSLDVQKPLDLWQKYRSVLAGKTPESIPATPSVDLPWYWRLLKDGAHINDRMPGLDSRKVEMEAYNEHRGPLDRRQLTFYRPTGELPVQDLNLHLCAHAYASDLNSLYIVANQLEVGESSTQMGSLAHTVIFHAPFEGLQFQPSRVGFPHQGNWFCKEDGTTRASVGRALYNSQIRGPDGVHIATVIQDGMLRVDRPPPDAGKSKL